MSPRIFGKSRKSYDREPANARNAVLVDFRLIDVSAGHLGDFYSRVDYPRKLDDGLLVHIGGVLDGSETVYLSVWRSDAEALASWNEKRADVEAVLADAPPNAEIHRRSSKLHRIYLGDDVQEFAANVADRKPDCVGFVIDLPETSPATYELLCERMNFPVEWPEGLLVHLAGPVDDKLRIVSVWRRVEDSRNYFASRLIPASVEIAREFGLFPEIRPVGLRVHMLALNNALAE